MKANDLIRTAVNLNVVEHVVGHKVSPIMMDGGITENMSANDLIGTAVNYSIIGGIKDNNFNLDDDSISSSILRKVIIIAASAGALFGLVGVGAIAFDIIRTTFFL